MRRRLETTVDRTHLEEQVRSTTVPGALRELVANSLDADATHISVRVTENSMGGIERIEVEDNGEGFTTATAETAFAKLGGSWKASAKRSPGGRQLLGRGGKGRIAAFKLGSEIRWETYSRDVGGFRGIAVTGSATRILNFELEELGLGRRSGTRVTVTGIRDDLDLGPSKRIARDLATQFALYLRLVTGVTITVNDHAVDPAVAQVKALDCPLPRQSLGDFGELEGTLTIIEWKKDVDKVVHLCDESGNSLYTFRSGTRSKNWNYTAYLRSPVIRRLADGGAFAADDLIPAVGLVKDAAKGLLRREYKHWKRANAQAAIDEWKRRGIYPYAGKPTSRAESARRDVFDLIAVQVQANLKGFRGLDDRSQRFSLRLLKQAIEKSPEAVQEIVTQVLELPHGDAEDMAMLLKRTSLGSIIAASKLVSERIDVLHALKRLVHEEPTKADMLERKELHCLLEAHCWIFGEQYALTVTDQTLTRVLREHLAHLRPELDTTEPVSVPEVGASGRIDLMLGRALHGARPEDREYLVVELKRPKVPIDDRACEQIRRYANAVSRDPRFRDTGYTFRFIAVSTDIADESYVHQQQNQAPGVIHVSPNGKVTTSFASWAQIIGAAESRMRFFEERFELSGDDSESLRTLRRLHAEILPASVDDLIASARVG